MKILSALFILIALSLPSSGGNFKEMSISELEDYLLPSIGTSQIEVEAYFGCSPTKTEANSGKPFVVYSYQIFVPVQIDVVYSNGKVTSRGIHHKTNLADWSSQNQFDISYAINKGLSDDQRSNAREWLKASYLRFIEGRKLIKQIDSPAWQKKKNNTK